jgi:oligopeptide transport system substrate-binding protein
VPAFELPERVGKYLRLILAAALLPWLGTGCSQHFARADLVFANGAEPETLDPALITGQLEGRLAFALFEGLTSFNAAGRPQPGVAERWDLSPDGKVYTFHLRANAAWSNGAPVTAQDFVQSWKRVLLPGTAAEYAYQLYFLKNAARFNNPAAHFTDFSQVGVQALDERTLRVTLEQPTPFFLDLCCTPTYLPVYLPAVQRWGDAWTKPGHIVTNGAFLLAAWRLNDRLRLRQNPTYWNRAAVHLRTIDALPINQANVALNFFASGACDLILDRGLTPVMLIGELRRQPYFHAAPFLGTFFIRFNCSRPPFNDARVRQAFSLAIDKERITTRITKAGEQAAYSFVPPGTAGYEPPKPGLVYDPDRARRLLAAAGFPAGARFPPVSFLYNEGELNRYIGIELKSMFERQLGISISLRPQENKVYLNSQSRLDYDMARASWIGDYDDPNTFLDVFVTGGGNNRCGFSDPAYDHLIVEAGQEQDVQKRSALFQRAETWLISEQTPICPLYYYVGVQLYRPDHLGGLQANLLDEHPLREMYLK